MVNYTIVEVKTKRDIKSFNLLPVKLYKGYSNWIRPIDDEVEAVFDPKQNKLFKDGEAVRFLLKDSNEEYVGRIAVFYNRSLALKEYVPTGGCGFFECINSQEAADMLFDTAKSYLEQHGMQAMDGPINFGTRDQFWGLLVEGFQAPIYGMNFNHIYYKELFENYGFKNFFDQYSYVRNLDAELENTSVAVRAERLRNSGEYEFRKIRSSDLKSLADNFRNIYNKAWANFTGVTEMTKKEGDELFKKLRPIIEKRLIYLSFHKGEVIGFYIMIPDINGAIKHLNGKFNLWAKLKFMYHLKVRKSCDIIIGLIFGVLPEYQGKGIESGMIDTFRRDIAVTKHHYKYIELVWVGDFNPLMMRMVEKYVCATKYKTHVTYRYLFDREMEFKRAERVSVSRKKEIELDARQ